MQQTRDPRPERPLPGYGLWQRLEAVCNRLYGARLNPIYQSGTIAIFCFLIMVATGLILFLFYSVSAPYASVARIEHTLMGGSVLRSLHRYAADVALIAVAVHAIKMFLSRRTWGTRALAWISGLALLGLVLVCGWTGLIMVWDRQGLAVARALVGLLDALPLFSEPLSLTFSGRDALGSSFFFMNLFLHLALPLGLALVLWLHVSRLARPVLLPPRALRWALLTLLLLAATVLPVPLLEAGDPLKVDGRMATDLWYAFWLPWTGRIPAGAVWIAGAILAGLAVAVPWLTRPAPQQQPQPSNVEPDLCTGCQTCYEDCPYDAISMVPRPASSKKPELSALVALVDPDRCVSCGICAGSCAPMGVGPPNRTGRMQLRHAQIFAGRHTLDGRQIILFCCSNGIGPHPELTRIPHVLPYPLGCAGNLHAAVVELLLRRGAAGAAILSCPPRDARFREGPKWLRERMLYGREADLKPRVDRRRILLFEHGPGEVQAAAAALAAFQQQLEALARPEAEPSPELDFDCDPPEEVSA